MRVDGGIGAMDVSDGQPPDTDAAPAQGGVLPMLASACPGWVCYAEKTQGAWVLPHISSAKSPQAVQGYGAHHIFATKQAVQPEESQSRYVG